MCNLSYTTYRIMFKQIKMTITNALHKEDRKDESYTCITIEITAFIQLAFFLWT